MEHFQSRVRYINLTLRTALDKSHSRSHHQSFVFKRVSQPFYDLSLRLAAEFPESRRFRMHVDFNEDEQILIYPYY